MDETTVINFDRAKQPHEFIRRDKKVAAIKKAFSNSRKISVDGVKGASRSNKKNRGRKKRK
ncbi:MAG: hypothetical protein KUG79_19640 [Pseudomonadales bacterium]|nr:hypothetical protein [Pseudomonadales bacterium]